uniref:Uncharacterized protein n=1 Tax=Rhizophora mucronata TaxID=61149 RepID=A0A2P2MEG1_RHIMU
MVSFFTKLKCYVFFVGIFFFSCILIVVTVDSQIYERFEASSLEDADDARLEYFTKKVWQIAPFLIYGTFNRVSSGGLCIQIGWSYLHAALAAYMPFYLYINRIHKDKWTCKQAMLHVNNPPIQIVVYIRPMQSACRIWNLTC